MQLDITEADFADKPLIRRMLELYYYDMSEFEGTDLREHGEYGYRYLDNYWNEEGRFPFIVRVDGKLAGFVLVNRYFFMDGVDQSIGEFCILRKYQGKGIGKKAAFSIFDRFPGVWEIRTQIENTRAVNFWHTVTAEYSPETAREYLDGAFSYNGPLWIVTSNGKKP